MIRHLFRIEPELLKHEKWAELVQEAFWIKRYDLKNQAEMLQALLGGKEESDKESEKEAQNE